MSISMTIKSGTARTFPQRGDSDLYGEVTSWANDVTTAINAAPTSNQTATYDAIVGTAANVTAGIATHSDIATAIAAVSANDRIYILENTYEPAAQIDITKALTIIGQGEGVDIQGDNLATGAVVKISASGVTLENVKITQGTGTPTYALEIAAAVERINLNIKADGTFSSGLFLNGSDVGAITGFIAYDTSSVFFGGESQMVEQVKIQDQTTAAYNLVIQSDSTTPLSADRILTIDCNNGARMLDLAENFTIGDGYNVTITAEDAASSIVLDEQSFEVEGEGTATRLFKLINSSDSARTLSFAADVTATGNGLTIAVEDAAGSITLDNCSIEVEDTIGSGNTIKFVVGTDDASRTVTLSENLTVGDGTDVTLVAEDAACTFTMDNANVEVENTDGTQRTWKFTSAKAGNTTVTLQEDFTIGDGSAVTITAEDAAGSITLDNCSIEVEDTVGSGNTIKFIIGTDDASRTVTLSENLVIGDGADITLTAEDAASSVTLDNCSFEVEDTIGSGNTIKFVIGTDDASRTVTLSENLTIGDGADVTIVAEDTAGTITLDEQNFEVEGEGTAAQLTKIVNANNAAATLTIEGTSARVNQDTTSDADVNFTTVTCVTDIDTPLVTNDSADLTLSTTTSGNININSVDETVIVSSGSATNATTQTVKFGDDTGGISGIRNLSGELQYNSGGGGWTAFNSEGGINYITNGGAEVDTTGWSAYADAAGSVPVDGSGGAPTVTWTRDTTTPLRGAGEFVLTKDAADRQGEGASYNFTIDPADIHSVLSISFDATTSANYADDDVIVYIYNTDSSTLIEPVPMELKAGEYGRYYAQFQTDDTDTNYRLIFHVSSTNAAAYTINIDNIKVGPSARNFGAPITDWTSYTPTGSWSSNSTYTGFWRRVGSNMEGQVQIALSGAPDSTDLSIDIPSGYTMDTAKLATAVGNKGSLGYGTINDATGFAYNIQANYADTNSIQIIHGDNVGGAINGLVDESSPITFANNDTLSIYFNVPILGWDSSVQMSDQDETRIVAARYETNNNDEMTNASTEVVCFEDLVYDTHNAVSFTNFAGQDWKFTAPIHGFYNINVGVLLSDNAAWDVDEIAYLMVCKNGAVDSYLDRFECDSSDQAALTVPLNGSADIELNKGDYIDIRCYQGSGANINLIATAEWNYISIHRISGPSAIAANELVAARYDTDAGQSIATGGYHIVDFDSTTWGYDTHGIVTTGASFKATANISGRFSVKAGVLLASSANWETGETAELVLYKNGSFAAELDYYRIPVNTTILVGLFGSTDIYLNKGDYVDIRVSQDSDAAISLVAGEEYNWMSIHRIGF